MKITTVDPETGVVTTKTWRGLHEKTIVNIIKRMSEEGVPPESLERWIERLRGVEVTGECPWLGK